jgi:hypothetical protein
MKLIVEENKYNNINTKECDFRSSKQPSHIKGSQKFFIKPQIRLYGLNRNHVNVAITEVGSHPEIFDVIIWTFEVENVDRKIKSLWPLKHIPKIDKTSLMNYSMSNNTFKDIIAFNVIKNRQTTFLNYCYLRWRTSDLPISCNTSSIENMNQNRRGEYVNHLPYCYIGQFLMNNESVDIPKKTNRDVLLFFTFKESDSLYFISHDGLDLLKPEDSPKLRFPLKEEFELNILFQSTQPSYSKSFSYRVIPNSWDKIHVKRIKSP